MQSLLDSTASILVIGFALIMALDFISGLGHLYCTSTPAPSAENQLEQAPAPQTEPASIALSTQPGPPQQVAPGWDLIESVGPEVATLSWLEQNMPPAEIYDMELPNLIALCKARQPQTQPIVVLASQQQLLSAGIRKCKKLASSLQIRHYNTMRLAELADVLVGKVTAAELAV